jgi:hypothetical protein
MGQVVKVWLRDTDGEQHATCAACDWTAARGLAEGLALRHAEENPNHAVTVTRTTRRMFELRETVNA